MIGKGDYAKNVLPRNHVNNVVWRLIKKHDLLSLWDAYEIVNQASRLCTGKPHYVGVVEKEVVKYINDNIDMLIGHLALSGDISGLHLVGLRE